MTLDGYCDHTAVDADEELHDHYTDLLRQAGAIVYGRITFQLMEYWKNVVDKPTGNKSADDFAHVFSNIPEKIVFSNTVKQFAWKDARVASKSIEEEIADLKRKPGKNILLGSRSIIIEGLNRNLVDEFQICVHPVIAGSGLLLFEKKNTRLKLSLIKTKTFASGAVVFYYKPVSD